MSTPTDLTLAITREFAAPPALVYEAWTQKEHLDRWSAPKGFTIPYSTGDLRPGGAWECVMVSPGGEEMRLGGVYQETVPGEHLSFTHVWHEDDGQPDHETLVDIRFKPSERGTRMSFHQDTFRSPESRDGHEGGWTECFDLLDALLRELSARPVAGA